MEAARVHTRPGARRSREWTVRLGSREIKMRASRRSRPVLKQRKTRRRGGVEPIQQRGSAIAPVDVSSTMEAAQARPHMRDQSSKGRCVNVILEQRRDEDTQAQIPPPKPLAWYHRRGGQRRVTLDRSCVDKKVLAAGAESSKTRTSWGPSRDKRQFSMIPAVFSWFPRLPLRGTCARRRGARHAAAARMRTFDGRRANSRRRRRRERRRSEAP